MFTLFTTLLGGLGMLLIGMHLMTDGLKLAAGNALRDILALWTHSRLRGLLSGFLITGIVMSSGAVTVATIGFANAGMLTLERAVWVIYGSNVGTTMTSWIVALLGFRVNIEALALPLIGVGALMRLFGGRWAKASLGLALVGFGLMFYGIGVLSSTFQTLSVTYTLPELGGPVLLAVAGYVLIGYVLTSLMQSSSAAMVLALSAAESGMIPLDSAAAVVIGANLGSTTTALISVFGATATAKRAAMGHLAFNLITALVAFVVLRPMFSLVSALPSLLGVTAGPALTLALFHSAFNVLGVMLMWPISGWLIPWLKKCFTTREEIESLPRYLDKNLLPLPSMAVDSLGLEMRRIGGLTVNCLRNSLRYTGRGAAAEEADNAVIILNLAREVGSYASDLNRGTLTPLQVEIVANLIESTQQYMLVVDIAEDIAQLAGASAQRQPSIMLRAAIDEYITAINRYLDGMYAAVSPQADADAAEVESEANMSTIDASMSQMDYEEVEAAYRHLKLFILSKAATGALAMTDVDTHLQYINQVKRACRQLWKATRRLQSVREALKPGSQAVGPGESSPLEILEQATVEIAEIGKPENPAPEILRLEHKPAPELI